jgi:hypothetical protein
VARTIAVKRSRNSLSLASTPGIDIHSPRPAANLYHAVHCETHSAIAPPARAASRGLCVWPKLRWQARSSSCVRIARRRWCCGPNSLGDRFTRPKIVTPTGAVGVLGPRRPVLRRAIAGIASDRISVTGVRRIGRLALVSVARPFRTAGPDAIRSLAPKQIYALEWRITLDGFLQAPGSTGSPSRAIYGESMGLSSNASPQWNWTLTAKS